jgi:hypothetical protein
MQKTLNLFIYFKIIISKYIYMKDSNMMIFML